MNYRCSADRFPVRKHCVMQAEHHYRVTGGSPHRLSIPPPATTTKKLMPTAAILLAANHIMKLANDCNSSNFSRHALTFATRGWTELERGSTAYLRVDDVDYVLALMPPLPHQVAPRCTTAINCTFRAPSAACNQACLPMTTRAHFTI